MSDDDDTEDSSGPHRRPPFDDEMVERILEDVYDKPRTKRENRFVAVGLVVSLIAPAFEELRLVLSYIPFFIILVMYLARRTKYFKKHH